MPRPKIVLLHAARSLGLFNISRFVTRSHVRILCYHAGCVGDESSYNPKLFCSTNTFRTRMEWLQRRGFNFVALDSATGARHSNTRYTPLRTVVTFDDGWSSTARELVPVLAAMGIPSALYLSTKNFLEGWPVLSVSVRYAIWKTGARQVQIEGFHAGVDGAYDLGVQSERRRLVQRAVAAIEAGAYDRAGVCAALERFAEFLGIDGKELGLDSRRFDYMSDQELLDLPAKGCAVELHGHVHHYPKGEPARFQEDLKQCRDTIVALGLPQPRHYCYPSGSFDSAAGELLSEMEVDSATTCIPGLAAYGDRRARHYLPRFVDGEDVHPLEFEAEVSGFSELVRRFLRAAKVRDHADPSHRDLLPDFSPQ